MKFTTEYMNQMLQVVLAGIAIKLTNYPSEFKELLDVMYRAYAMAEQAEYDKNTSQKDVKTVSRIQKELDGIGAGGEIHACADFLGMCRGMNAEQDELWNSIQEFEQSL